MHFAITIVVECLNGYVLQYITVSPNGQSTRDPIDKEYLNSVFCYALLLLLFILITWIAFWNANQP